MNKIDFPVVGIGASAGGLKALQEFFDNIPEDSGIAFVVIVHLAPQRTSAMSNLLSSHTLMKVNQVSKTTQIKPNHIYVIPPDKKLEVTDGTLQLSKVKGQPKGVIDVFFRSLAKRVEKQAIGIILSGTGSDGTLGLKAIKENGGVTMVQDPSEAEYEGMPRSAQDTGIVDFVMPVRELAQKVMDHKEFLGKVQIPLHTKDLSEKEELALKEIFELLLLKKKYDFNGYKRTSVLRRLQRRMHVTCSETIYDYRSYLDDHANEIEELFKDLLISVTNFFRDPEAFENLEKKVIPKLFEGKDASDQIRAWSIGCATGEELYSLAILLYEHASKLDHPPQIKIFGTDISEEALRIARKGFYPHSIAADISQDRLKNFFQEEESGYRVRREIREMVLVSKHNVISDPPFTNLDLIACRNLLIYFNSDLQQKVLRLLQFSLKTNGYLFLGMSESAVGAGSLFETVANTKAIFKSKKLISSLKDLPPFLLWQNMRKLKGINKEKISEIGTETSFEEIHKALLAEQYGPPSVIINDKNEAMHFSRGVNQYLEYGEGEPTSDLLKLVRPELQRALRSVLYRFNQMTEPQQVVQQARVVIDGESRRVIIRVQPIVRSNFPSGYRQVLFEETKEPDTEEREPERPPVTESSIVEQLESELNQTKEELQQTIEEYEASNEELMASNEELQSMNEELQTATEELETNQEELQSVNEELRTVNQELETKIEELEQANIDLKNLMEATEIAIVFVDRNMKIMRFTGKAEGIFNFIDSDVGRLLSDVRSKLRYENLVDDIEAVFGDLEHFEKQVSTENGRWYNMGIEPNMSPDNNIEGAVLTFVDITKLKEVERELEDKIKIQKQLQQDVLRVENKERWSIGQFLHDEISQNLLASKTLLDNLDSKDLDKEVLEELRDIRNSVIDSLNKIRELSHFVLPLGDDIGSGVEALNLLAKQTENVHKIESVVTYNDGADKIKDSAISSSLYYIAQEAINNAIKHGKASKIDIDLTADNRKLDLTVKDNGDGYDRKKKGNGEGINIMRYRAELLGGHIEIKALPNKGGTVVKCSIPLNEEKTEYQ